MQNHPDTDISRQPRKPRVRLPFEPKESDPGTWSYDHRRGICITLIVYLIFGIAFMWGKIELGPKRGEGNILVDFQKVEELRQMLTPEQLQQLQSQNYDDFSDVRNRTSNENAELNARLRDAKGTDATQIYEDAGKLDGQMAANRQAYEEGLRQEREMIERARNSQSSDDGKAEDSKESGRVVVSFSFTDPVRNKVNLIIPAYRCEGGGEVVVNAVLDVNGNVTSATVDKALSAPDDCMQTTAVKAALGSRFNADSSAPARHRGTISYIFIPQ